MKACLAHSPCPLKKSISVYLSTYHDLQDIFGCRSNRRDFSLWHCNISLPNFSQQIPYRRRKKRNVVLNIHHTLVLVLLQQNCSLIILFFDLHFNFTGLCNIPVRLRWREMYREVKKSSFSLIVNTLTVYTFLMFKDLLQEKLRLDLKCKESLIKIPYPESSPSPHIS